MGDQSEVYNLMYADVEELGRKFLKNASHVHMGLDELGETLGKIVELQKHLQRKYQHLEKLNQLGSPIFEKGGEVSGSFSSVVADPSPIIKEGYSKEALLKIKLGKGARSEKYVEQAFAIYKSLERGCQTSGEIWDDVKGDGVAYGTLQGRLWKMMSDDIIYREDHKKGNCKYRYYITKSTNL